MPKRYIGLDIGPAHVRAAQLVRTGDGLRLEKAFARHTRRSSDCLAAIVQSLREEHGFDRHAPVTVCLPPPAFFFADLEVDAAGLEALRAGPAASVPDCFPIPAEDLIAQVCATGPLAQGQSAALVGACSRRHIEGLLQSLAAGKVKPAGLAPPIAAVQATVLTNHPEAAAGLSVILYLDAATLTLAVLQEGRLRLVRNLPLPPDEPESASYAQQTAEIVAPEIAITFKRLLDREPASGLRLFLAAGAPVAPALASGLADKTGGQVTLVCPCARLTCAADIDPALPLAVAVGLALAAPGSGSNDFLAAYRARTRPKLRLRRELGICGALAAAAAVVWAAGLLLQLSSLEGTQRQLQHEIETVFRQTLPDEQNLVDPAAQMQQRLEALRKECGLLTSLSPGRSGPLEVLYALSRSSPAHASVKLQDVLIAAESVRISGTCDSFTTLSQWQRELEALPGLRVIDVPRPTKDASSGKVRFTISLATGASKA